MSPARYKIEREKRGTQKNVAAQLGVQIRTIQRREAGDIAIGREAEIAILNLKKLKNKEK